jgi:hypothetical protein
MSRRTNLVRASLAACGLSLLLPSTSWANVLNVIHVQPAVLHVPIHNGGAGVKGPSSGEAHFKRNGGFGGHFKNNGNNGGNNNGSFGNCRPAGGGRWIC